jgi:hypothetical protein
MFAFAVMEILDTEDLIDDFQFGIHKLILFQELLLGAELQYPTIVAKYEIAQSKRGDPKLRSFLREIYLRDASLARAIRSCVTYMKTFAREKKPSCEQAQAVMDLMVQVASFNEDNLRRRDDMDDVLHDRVPAKEHGSMPERVNHGLDLRSMVEEVMQMAEEGGSQPTCGMVQTVIDRHFKRVFKQLYPRFDVCAVAREAKYYCYFRKVSEAINRSYLHKLQVMKECRCTYQ